MSRRRGTRRRRAGVERPSAEQPGHPPRQRPAPRPGSPRRFVAQVGILVAVFAVVSLIAELAGAANLGVALGIGEIAFAIALMSLMLSLTRARAATRTSTAAAPLAVRFAGSA